MATLASQDLKRTGVTPTYAAASGGGDRFTPTKDTFIHVKNGGGGAITVTVPSTYVPLPNHTESNVSVSVGAGSEKMIGPFPAEHFTAADGSGLGDITYSGVTTVTVAAVKVNQP